VPEALLPGRTHFPSENRPLYEKNAFANVMFSRQVSIQSALFLDGGVDLEVLHPVEDGNCCR